MNVFAHLQTRPVLSLVSIVGMSALVLGVMWICLLIFTLQPARVVITTLEYDSCTISIIKLYGAATDANHIQVVRECDGASNTILLQTQRYDTVFSATRMDKSFVRLVFSRGSIELSRRLVLDTVIIRIR